MDEPEVEVSQSPRTGPDLLREHSTGSSWDRPQGGHWEEEKPVFPGITTRAATLDVLITKLMENFDDEGSVIEESEFPRVMLLMHRWFMTSEELAQRFLDLYLDCDTEVICSLASCTHQYNSTECLKHKYRASVVYSVRYWIQTFPVHFDIGSAASVIIQELVSALEAEGHTKLQDLLDMSKVPSYDWMRNKSVMVRQPSKVSLVFNNLDPKEVAEQLTFLEYKAFRRISFDDYKQYAVHTTLKDNPKLERSISLFNGLSQWIQCMVLSKTTPQERSNVVAKFINVAKVLRNLQNFNTLMAVVGGLTHSALARLGKTNSCLPLEAQKSLIEFTELLSSSNNFSNYRKVLLQCTGFTVPILGVHLKDLILLHTALPDKVEGDLINFRKMAQMSTTFLQLLKVQDSSVPIEPNMDLVNMLRLSLDLRYTEDEIYELSLAREPRNSLSSPSTPTKPVVFADWVSGVSPPEATTINKHVHDMVEAVFKNYDHDKDGLISQNEFELIAGNFPFIDSFCVLDADQDGMISKAEMEDYFIRANCHALRSSFKHEFHETTYFKPTFCIHCTGLLWGLIKQGWKCKECSINAHKHCKDLVVMECRKHSTSGQRDGRCNSLSNDATSSEGVSLQTSRPDVTLATKRKMSQRHKQSSHTKGTQTEADPNHSNLRHALARRIINEPLPEVAEEAESRKREQDDDEFYEETPALYERLLKAEESRDKLLKENVTLHEQIGLLKNHIRLIRQHTITFILDQMDTLHMQRDTEV